MSLFFRSAAVFLSLACCSLLAQKKNAEPGPPAPLPPELKHFVELNDLNQPGMTPWHLKAAFHRYGPKGKVLEDGIFEEWWLTPASWKLIVQQDGLVQTFVHDRGQNWSTEASDMPPLSVEILEPLLVKPAAQGLDANFRAEKKPRLFDSMPLSCFVAKHSDLSESVACFDATGGMRTSSRDLITYVRNGIKPFLGHPVATAVVGVDQTGKVLAAEVKELNTIDSSQVDLGTSALVASVISSEFFSDEFSRWRYPKVVKHEEEESNHDWTAMTRVVTDTTGQVESVDVLAVSTPDLMESAERSIRKLVFEARQVNGQPAKTEWVFTMSYHFTGFTNFTK